MHANQKRLITWGILAFVVFIGLLFSLWPRAVVVDITSAGTGPMMLTVGDEGETRVVDVFVVSAPVTGRLRRIDAEPGDPVTAGETTVAEIEPVESQPLDARSEAETEAQLSAARSAASLAAAELDRASAELRFAESELKRSRELASEKTISQRDLEASEKAYDTSRAALAVAQANLQMREYELTRVRAQLMSPEELASQRELCDCLNITSPVDGQVLQVLRESEGFVRAGEGLIEIGNPENLEIVVDLLSVDAVRVRPGSRAIVDNWGGENALVAKVRRVEPLGFTKVSALGIEEQRVNVVLDITSPSDAWKGLGHGYKVDVHVVLWEEDEVLQVPLTALFRVGDDWAVFINENGRATRRTVEVGHTSTRQAQILSGLQTGEQIVVYPGETIDEGVRIAALM